jgi:hypothetical protein
MLLYSTLHCRGSTSESRLFSLLAPKGLPDNAQVMVGNTLRRWTELGMFVVNKQNRYSISDEYRVSPRAPEEGFGVEVRRVTRRAIFAPANNTRFWEATESKAADLTRSTAWILAQEVYSLEWSELSTVESRQLTREDARIAQNDTRLNGLKMWARFLGFLWDDLDAPAVDPTEAIRDTLDAVLPTTDEVPVDAFLGRLAEQLPVLDSGSYRKEVESNLDSRSWTRPATGAVSTSLSRALLRLRRELEIDWLARSDTRGGVLLLGATGPVSEAPITHVARKKKV